jgi:hypothetical protein
MPAPAAATPSARLLAAGDGSPHGLPVGPHGGASARALAAQLTLLTLAQRSAARQRAGVSLESAG